MSAQPDARQARATLLEAARLIREDPEREGALLRFGAAGQVVMTGDLHGNLWGLAKLQRFCALQRYRGRRVVLHELIHQEPERAGDMDLSIDLLVRAAAWKCEYPDNVFFLLSNHELSQLRRHEITKGGRSVILDFEHGVRHRFGGQADEVLAAVDEYIAALPLAARTANGVFLAHSLPDPLSISTFDATIFERAPTDADMEPGGAVYALVWGRFHTAPAVEVLAERLEVQTFVVGHTPQEMGHEVIGRLIILASNHAHGSFLPIDLQRSYTTEQLAGNIRKFAAVE
jgi:hypothetical protein